MQTITLSNFHEFSYFERYAIIEKELKGKVHLYRVMARSLAERGVYCAQRTQSEGGEWHWWFVTEKGIERVAGYVSPHRSRMLLSWITPKKKVIYEEDLYGHKLNKIGEEAIPPKITINHIDIIRKYLNWSSYTAVDVAKEMGWERKLAKRDVHKHDILWSYLKNAQDYSDAAKGRGTMWDYCQKKAYSDCPYFGTRTWSDSFNEAKDWCYSQKQNYIDKALKRAVAIGINVVYDINEECVYFETENGQCSFHDFRSEEHFSNLGATISEDYKWSGLQNTREIIYNAVGKTA